MLLLQESEAEFPLRNRTGVATSTTSTRLRNKSPRSSSQKTKSSHSRAFIPPSASSKQLRKGRNMRPNAVDSRPTAATFRHDLITGTQCPVCNRCFETNAILRRHYGIHDGYYNAICLDCGTGYSKLKQLRHHKSRVHKTAKSDDLVCHLCNGVFENNYRLTKHMEWCISSKFGANHHQCFLCLKTFSDWSSMKCHAWTHLSKCSFCDEKFVTQTRRVEHMLSCSRNPLTGNLIWIYQPVHCSCVVTYSRTHVTRMKS